MKKKFISKQELRDQLQESKNEQEKLLQTLDTLHRNYILLLLKISDEIQGRPIPGMKTPIK